MQCLVYCPNAIIMAILHNMAGQAGQEIRHVSVILL